MIECLILSPPLGVINLKCSKSRLHWMERFLKFANLWILPNLDFKYSRPCFIRYNTSTFTFVSSMLVFITLIPDNIPRRYYTRIWWTCKYVMSEQNTCVLYWQYCVLTMFMGQNDIVFYSVCCDIKSPIKLYCRSLDTICKKTCRDGK